MRLGTGVVVAPLQQIETEQMVTQLRSSVGDERWRVWFDGSTDFHLTPDGLTVGVANLFISDYLKSHFTAQLSEAARRAFGRDLTLSFRVQPDLFRDRRAHNLAGAAEAIERLADPVRPGARDAASALPAETRTLFTLDNFVVGPCNQMAYAAARSAATMPGKDFHPLFIHGGCGLGKTHLLNGILHDLRRRGNLRIACLSAEQFTNRYLTGMRTGGLDAFRHRYRNLDVLAIDDVHFLSGKPATQDEFLHTFNEFEGCGRLIILASDSHPHEIQAVQDRLISRWVAGLVVRLSAPDVVTRRRILEAKAAQFGRPISADVLSLVAERVQGSVRDLEGALTRIIAAASLLQHPLTVDLARQSLADFVAAAPARTTLTEIEEAVTSFFGVTTGDIRSHRKTRQISLARQLVMVLARDLTSLSFSEIARSLGNKNHTTVLAACRKWQTLRKSGAEVTWQDRSDTRSLPAEALVSHLKDRIRR